MKTLDVINELNSCEGYQVALLTTYSCDINFINRLIVNKLLEQNCNKIILFVDRKMLSENLIRDNNIRLGSKYIINPIKTENAFHPKVFLLLGKDKAKVMIGSGNLTCAGMLSNTEVFTEFEYSIGNKENLGMIQSAYKMILNIAEQNTFPLQNDIFDFIKDFEYLYDYYKQNEALWWMDNCKTTISNQLIMQIKEPIDSIDIIVPYFDSKCFAMDELISCFKANRCRVFVQNGKSNLKADKIPANTIAYCFDKFYGNSKLYHSKVFIFRGIDHDYILYGSANCSMQALFKNIKSGNYEACVLEKGNKGDFNYYLDCIDDYIELKNVEYTSVEYSEKITYSNTYFEFALLNEDGLVIELHQNNIIPIKEVNINDKSVLFVQSENKILIMLFNPAEYIKEESAFNILVREKSGDTYHLVGWYLDKQSIMYTHDNKKEIIKLMVMNGQWDTDLPCIINIIREFQEKSCWNYNELTQSEDYIKKKLEYEIEMNESINDNPDEYIFDDVKSYDKGFLNSLNSKSLIHIFYEFGMKRFNQNILGINSNGKKYIEDDINQVKTKISEIYYNDYYKKWLAKQLKNLLKSYYSSFEDKEYMTEVSCESFWEKNIAVLEFARNMIESEAYNHFQSNKNIQLALNTEELVKMYVSLIRAIIEFKKHNELTEESKLVLISMSIFSVIWTFYNTAEMSVDVMNDAKRILDMLRQLIANDIWFRDNYISMAPLLESYAITEVAYSEKEMVDCFEKLFDYHSLNTASNKLRLILEKSFSIIGEDKLEVLVKLGCNEKLSLSKGNIKDKIRETIITLRKVETCKKPSNISVTFIADTGNIRKYTISYSLILKDMKEVIQYENGKISNFRTDRFMWRL